jgi:hypothetical protein
VTRSDYYLYKGVSDDECIEGDECIEEEIMIKFIALINAVRERVKDIKRRVYVHLIRAGPGNLHRTLSGVSA